MAAVKHSWRRRRRSKRGAHEEHVLVLPGCELTVSRFDDEWFSHFTYFAAEELPLPKARSADAAKAAAILAVIALLTELIRLMERAR